MMRRIHFGGTLDVQVCPRGLRWLDTAFNGAVDAPPLRLFASAFEQNSEVNSARRSDPT